MIVFNDPHRHIFKPFNVVTFLITTNTNKLLFLYKIVKNVSVSGAKRAVTLPGIPPTQSPLL